MSNRDTSRANERLSSRSEPDLLEKVPSLKRLIESGELLARRLPKGQILFRQGDPAESFFLLMSGMLGVGVTMEDASRSVVEKLPPQAIVGELSVLTGRPRAATVYALSECRVIEVDRSRFDSLTTNDPDFPRMLADAASPRWRLLQLHRVLHAIFGQLEADQIGELREALDWCHLSSGQVLVEQGDSGDGMFIVVHGRLQIIVTGPDGTKQTVGEVGAGETVGEFALITGEPRSATVKAVRESDVVKMTQTDFEELVKRYPDMMWPITRIIVERQQRRLRGIIRGKMAALSLALVPKDDDQNVTKFAEQLTECLCEFGPSLLLDSKRFDQHFGMAGAAQIADDDAISPAISAWLNEQEVIHDFMVYVCDPTWTPWTQKCLNQVDRILVIAEADRDTAPGSLEQKLEDMSPSIRTDLVLWHPPDQEEPSGTVAWLERRQVERHYHVRRDDMNHMRRLARTLSNRAIGLALSGGGARGFVHLGVFRALEELQIPIDYIGGTSMGSVTGGMMALNLSFDELLLLAGRFANPKSLFDYTLPFTAIMASGKVTRLLQRLFGSRRIEDLWIPFFCVSTNLTRAEPVVHDRGEMWKAVRSSVSIPGIFSPVLVDGELLVDGGPMNNFPVDLVAEKSESRRIIAVQASQHVVKKIDYDLEGSVSGWRILLGRLLPFIGRKRAPSIAGTILRTMEVNSVYQARHRATLAELLIQPKAKQFSFLDFGSYEPIVKAGYEAGLESLRRWKERQEL